MYIMGMRIVRVNQHLSRMDERLSKMFYLREHPKTRLYESMTDWAEREVQLALKKNSDPYGSGCYKSALKAFHSLMDDGHSGCSIGITKQILNRLIDGRPLTPIEDDPEIWNECGWTDEDKTTYQCSRMSALFKDVYKDGTVSFHDIDRVTLVEIYDDGHEGTWHSGLASQLVDEVCGPITLPYIPVDKPYKVYAQQFDSVNAEPGCFDTVHIIKIVDPDGNEIPCERFYAETSGPDLCEIDKDTYDQRRESYLEALKRQ